MNMGIEGMTNMSYMLFAASGIFLVAAVVVFFAMDIAKCWRMVSGVRSVHGKSRLQTDRTVFTNETTVFPDNETSTILLDAGNLRETEVLDTAVLVLHPDRN